MRVARNRSLADISCFKKWPIKFAEQKLSLFFHLRAIYQEFFLVANMGIFIISSIAAKKNVSKCPLLPILAGFCVHLFDWNVFDRISYLQLPRTDGPIRMLL